MAKNKRRARNQTPSFDKRSGKVRRVSIEDAILDVSSVASTDSSSSTSNSTDRVEGLVPATSSEILTIGDRESPSIKFRQSMPETVFRSKLSLIDAKKDDTYADNPQLVVDLCEPQQAFDVVCDDFEDISTKVGQHPTRSLWQVIAMFSLIGVMACTMFFPPTATVEKQSICVSGGGFSGFWFTLGRLESLSQAEIAESNFYCYSAGCLGVVARMKNYTLEDMYSMASSCQNMWYHGKITRYEVVEHFVNKLLASDQDQTFSPESLSRLNVLTTVKDSNTGWRTSVRTPNSMISLRKMLIQSAWIPFAVGSGLWYHDHMDGAFSVNTHPRCERDVGLIWDFDLMSNVVNVNLGRGAVERLWRKGIVYGI